MSKVIVPFSDIPASEIEQINGVFMAFSWDALIPTISEFVRLRPDEVIDGLVVSDTDIKVKISRKKGRKLRSKKEVSDNNQTKLL